MAETPGPDGRPPGRPPAATPLGRFRSEVRGAITPRAGLIMLGVLVIELAFVVSYIGAFHSPTPDRIPVAVVAPAAEQGAVIEKLNSIPGEPLEGRPADSAAQARAMVLEREVDAALLVAPQERGDRLLVASAGGPSGVQTLELVFRKADPSRPLQVTDLRPPNEADGRGLASFYLAVGLVVGGYLASAAASASYGARPPDLHRVVIRLGALAVLSVLSGLGGAIIADQVFDALTGHFAAIWWIGALTTFAAAAAGMAFQVLLGPVGIALSVVIFVVLGNPSAGGVYPAALLPPFWRDVGPALPNGASVTLLRNYAYFGGHHTATAWWVLSAWAVGGVLVSALVVWLRRRPAAADGPPSPAAAGGTGATA
ncbi:ABC transporter permease [Streptomyces althioticus]|uniref:ABC transporter permease n=1 Tax=Streptomyces althioticus TaxID=83380 RepID=UPI0018770088|nr:membrane protein [Streptomyces althioticus]